MTHRNPRFPQQFGVSGLTDDQATRIDALFQEWDRPDSPGAALGVYRHGQIAYSRGYGMSNLEHAIPIIPDSIFHIASISKQFAGISIGLLAHEGHLDVDADIRNWLPEVPDFGVRITIRHLMLHTSGLRDQWALLGFAGWRQEDLVTDEDVLDLVSRQRELNFTPGDRFLYSNTGYTLMSLIVRRITGQSLRQFAGERLFSPLGMTRTHFQDDHSEIVSGRTQAYLPLDGGGYRISVPEFDVAGATSLFSTVEDFFHWNEQFSTGQIVPRTVLDLCQKSGTTNDGKDISYGWGIATSTYRGLTLIGHSGADHGYRSEYQRVPEHGIGVTVFANLGSISPARLVRSVFDILLADHLEPGTEVPDARPIRTDNPPSDLAQYAGLWRDASTESTQITTVVGDQLRLGFGDSRQLDWCGNNVFNLSTYPLSRISFDLGNDGQASSLTIDFGWGASTLSRIEQSHDIGIAAFAGIFESDELGVTWEIMPKNGALKLKRRKRPDSDLIAINQHLLAGGDAISPMEFTCDRDTEGRVTGFRLTQGRIRNLRFDRVS